MGQAGAREYFRPGYGRLQSEFEEQERRQKRRVSAGYHHDDSTCMCYRFDVLPCPEPGGTLAIDLKNGGDFSCGCSSDKIGRLGGNSPADLPTLVFASSSPRWPSSAFKQPVAEMKDAYNA